MITKYKNVSALTEAVVSHHKSGHSLNPSGFRFRGAFFTFDDSITATYNGSGCVLGNAISGRDVQAYVKSILLVLDEGGIVEPARAGRRGNTLECRVTRATQADKARQELSGALAAQAAQAAQEAQDILLAQAAEEALLAQEAGEALLAPEAVEEMAEEAVEEAVEDIFTFSEEPLDSEPQGDQEAPAEDVISLEVASSFLEQSKNKTEAKKALGEYAAQFGFELDRNKKFLSMLDELTALVEGQ